MIIKEVEEKTGIMRSSIRFYEKEQLIQPSRNESNGYREYSEEDVENIKKIAYLRTLGVSLENIRKIMNHGVSLRKVLAMQEKTLDGEMENLQRSKVLCQKMLMEEDISYDTMKVENYVPDSKEYWKENGKIFKMDSVTFMYLWGNEITWGIITAISLLTAVLLYPGLPEKIPVQWGSGGSVSREVEKIFIFAYPLLCILFRFFVRPFLWRWCKIRFNYEKGVSDYLTNFLCFVILSLEMFTTFYVNGIVRNVWVLLFIDAVVFLGMGLIGWRIKDKGAF